MTGVVRDLRYALRTLRHAPVFTAVAVLSLALGIGANTAIFTLLDQLMLRLLPVKDPAQLVLITTPGPHMGNNRGSNASSYPHCQDFREKAQPFSEVFCRYSTPLSLATGNETERVNAELVSGNFFTALGVKPAAGRVFNSKEDDQVYKGHPVVVLSHDYWVSRFAANPKVIGSKISVNSYPMTIIGVSAAGFVGLDPSRSPQIRVPILMKPLLTPGWDDLANRRSRWVQTFGRLKPGYTAASAQAALQPLYRTILEHELTLPALREISDFNRKRFLARKVELSPAANGYSETRRTFGTALIVLMAMVGLVLLIACANVANLLIARAMARRKEIAVRLAIGASQSQLLRQLLLESVVLSVSGAMVGILFSVWTISALLRLLPTGSTPLMLRAEPDARILAFNLALGIFTGILFGFVPALQSTRFDLWSTLKDVVGAIAGGAGSVRLRKVLVTAQVALSFLLLAGSGLFVRSLMNLKNTHTGFEQMDNLVTFQVQPALNGYSEERIQAFYKDLLENVRTLPGVKSAAFASVALLHGDEWDSEMGVEGYTANEAEDMQAFMNSLSPGYFNAMGVPLLDGRDFDWRDFKKQSNVAIVNRKFADFFFPKGNAIGRRIGYGRAAKNLRFEIIGIVENSLYEGPREGVRRQVFVPNGGFQGVAFYVRAASESRALYNALRAEVNRLDPAMPIFEMKTLENQLDETLTTERLIAALSSAFGILATILATIGLYGVMAFSVARRTKELGLRMALGAAPARVIWLVLREVLLLLIAGLAIGLPIAWALSRYVSSQLFDVKPADLTTAIAAIAILSAVSLAAGFIPARKASRIDPLIALRYE
ncbi:MAG: ABC transporter permease [Bryobacterales bacterium]|nr:ABC transporter permease [Bryobacterales bacterium]